MIETGVQPERTLVVPDRLLVPLGRGLGICQAVVRVGFVTEVVHQKLEDDDREIRPAVLDITNSADIPQSIRA